MNYQWWMRALADGRRDYLYTWRSPVGYVQTNYPSHPLWFWG